MILKKAVIFATIFLTGLFSAAAADSTGAQKPVVFSVGLSSGFPFYDGDVKSENKKITDGDYRRFIIGVNAGAAFRLADPLKLLVGADTLCDFIWGGGDHCNHLDYAFFAGVKFYPGIGGLNASVAYALGCRADFIDNDEQGSRVHSSSWGNGFRLGAEYDLAYNRNASIAPALGIYYRWMPRGDGEYDNILAAVLSVVF